MTSSYPLKWSVTIISSQRSNVKLFKSVYTSYYEMEQRAYNWENSVQAKALVETSCIFVGFSGEDYNFRRIIKNVSPEGGGPRHYIFICLNDLINKVYEKDLARCGKEEFIYEGLQLINRLYAQYSYWKRHGIIPIWSTYEELPGMIGKLMYSKGEIYG